MLKNYFGTFKKHQFKKNIKNINYNNSLFFIIVKQRKH